MKRLIIAAAVVVALTGFTGAVLVLLNDGHTLRRDRTGKMHGTGVEEVHYPSGALKMETSWQDGEPIWTKWYAPDGREIARTRWQDGNGTYYFLDETGRVTARGDAIDGEVIHGMLHYLDEAGQVVRSVEYEDGYPVDSD